MLRISTMGLCLSLVFPAVGRSSDNDELLEQVRLGHRAARLSIKQFSCSYRVQQTLPTKNIMANGIYARSGDVVSIRNGEVGTATEDMVFRGGTWRIVGRSWKEKKVEYATVTQSDSQFFSWGDVWQRMSIDHSDWEGNRCSFDRVLDRIAKNARLSKVRIEGRDCILIEVEEKTMQGYTKNLKLWHDVGNNYLIRRGENFDLEDPRDRIVFEVTEFQEPVSGVFVPVKSRSDTILIGKLAASAETILSDIVVNQPIPDSSFTLPTVPNGTRNLDQIRGTDGKIGSDWKPVGPTTTMPQGRIPVPVQSEAIAAGQPTAAEPWSLNQYLLYGSLIVFGICMSFLVVRRYRASGETIDGTT